MTDLKRHGDDRGPGRSGDTWFRWSGRGQGAARGRPARGCGSSWQRGTKHDLVLELSDREFTAEPPDAGQSWAATEEAWSRGRARLR